MRSVLSQTYADLELIIVDDASPDNMSNAVSAFQDERIRYIKNEKNIGAALSRNRALREARGEWIAFLDSDDMWRPQKLEKQLDFMIRNHCALSYHAYSRMDEHSEPLNILVTAPKQVTERMIYRYNYIGCLTIMYHVPEIGLIQINDLPKLNDYAMLLQLCRKTDARYLAEDLAFYRVRSNSLSDENLLKKIRTRYRLFRNGDGCSPFRAARYTVGNLIFGAFKKLCYEHRIRR